MNGNGAGEVPAVFRSAMSFSGWRVRMRADDPEGDASLVAVDAGRG